MESLTNKFKPYFYDKTFIEDIVQLYENADTQLFVKEFINRIISEIPVRDLLTELYTKAKADSFSTDVLLSDCFFIVSELEGASEAERDLALDMSVFLSEDSDSRDPSFNPEVIFSKI